MPIVFSNNCPGREGTGASSLKIFRVHIEQYPATSFDCWVSFSDTPDSIENGNYVESDSLRLRNGDAILKKFQQIATDPRLQEKLRAFLLEKVGRCPGAISGGCLPLNEENLRAAINKTLQP